MSRILGQTWNDLNNNGIKDIGEPTQAGVSVYLDLNNNQVLDANELNVITDADGQYEFNDLLTGVYTVRLITPTGTSQVFPTQNTPSIPFQGLEANNQGVAAWNTDGSGAEPAKIGHLLPLIELGGGVGVAYYYLASRDYVDPASKGSIQGSGAIAGFSNFTTALADNGYSASDLTVKFGLASLGEDIEGQDWLFSGDTETRYYTGGNITFQLKGEDLIGASLPRLILQTDYNELSNNNDDRISGWTDSFIPENKSTNSSSGVQEIAQSLLIDIGNQGIRFVFNSFQPAAQTEFIQEGRGGGFFEAQFGQIELPADFSIRDGAYTVILDPNETIQNLDFGFTQQRLETVSAPNTLINPDGFGTRQYLTAGAVIPYIIRFTNNADQGTTPIAQVTITQELDTDLDLNTFTLNDFGFGDITVDVPVGVQNYSQRLDLRDARGVFVDVSAELNRATGVVTWTLTAIDPATNNPVDSATQGFLPPNDATNAGRGFVSYSIQPQANSANNTRIDAQATITFNNQTPIQTTAVFNTLDSDIPTSTVNVLPTNSNPNFTVSWTGSDNGSGIATYDVYVATDGGEYVLWQEDTTETSATYNGEEGKSYSFYSIATDNLGLIETAPTQADATTTVTTTNTNTNTGSDSIELKLTQGDVFTITGVAGKAKLQVTLTGRNSNLVNELGVFTVDDVQGKINGIAPGETGYTQAALEKSKVIFSTIANVPNGFNINNLTSLLEFNSGDNLRFFLIKNSTIDNVRNGITPITNILFSDLSNQKITNLGTDGFSLAWKDGSNNADFKDLLVNIQSTNKSLPVGTNLQGRQQGEVIDLRGINQDVKVDFVVNREANFNNFVGFYKVADENGGIDIDGDGTIDFRPGDSGYAQAAVKNRVAGIDLRVENQGTATFTEKLLTRNSVFAPFILTNGRTVDQVLNGQVDQIYFAYLGANSDKVDHVRLLGNNTFGFEDLVGGGDNDFNDVIIQAKFTL